MPTPPTSSATKAMTSARRMSCQKKARPPATPASPAAATPTSMTVSSIACRSEATAPESFAIRPPMTAISVQTAEAASQTRMKTIPPKTAIADLSEKRRA